MVRQELPYHLVQLEVEDILKLHHVDQKLTTLHGRVNLLFKVSVVSMIR